MRARTSIPFDGRLCDERAQGCFAQALASLGRCASSDAPLSPPARRTVLVLARPRARGGGTRSVTSTLTWRSLPVRGLCDVVLLWRGGFVRSRAWWWFVQAVRCFNSSPRPPLARMTPSHTAPPPMYARQPPLTPGGTSGCARADPSGGVPKPERAWCGGGWLARTFPGNPRSDRTNLARTLDLTLRFHRFSPATARGLPGS